MGRLFCRAARCSRNAFSAVVAAVALAAGCAHHPPPGPAAPPTVAPLFTEIAERSGVRFHHRTGKKAAANIMETTGAGCAVFDYDNDGWLDIYMVNGMSPPGDGNHLFHNNHDGTFTDVTKRAGVAALGHGMGMGCAVGDYDGDGYLDLLVTFTKKNALFHNNGGGTFTEVTDRAGLAGGGFSTAAAFADLDGDGKPDIYIARYCEFNSSSKQLCNMKGFPTSCPPYFYQPLPDLVYKNMGDGTFKHVEKPWGMVDSSGRGLGVVTVDFDRDGKLDLFVANDGSPNFLWRNHGGGRFENVAAAQGVALTDSGTAIANMGCDFGDFMGDGNLGLVTAVFDTEELAVWRYTPNGGFQYVSRQTGLSQKSRPLLKFGVGFADFDNDGLLDIFLSNGHVQDRIADIQPGSHYAQSRSYYRNVGKGRFEDETAEGGEALTSPAVGRGAAFGDLFNDGGIDVVVNNCDGTAMVIRNDNPRKNWVELRLISAGRNWEAIGATAELYTPTRKITRFVHTAYSFASANDHRLHFGLGGETRVQKVVVTWPGGRKTEYHGIPTNRTTDIVESEGAVPAGVKRLLQAGRRMSSSTSHKP
jgi:hypothetical protein